MGGKAAGGGLGGGAGKSGGGGPVIAPGQAGGAAGVTGMRQQRLADAVKKVGVRSGAAGGLTSPPSPRIRPTGPGGPGVDPGVPLPPTRPSPPPQYGPELPTGTGTPGFGPPGSPGVDYSLQEGQARPALASAFDDALPTLRKSRYRTDLGNKDPMTRERLFGRV